MILQKEAINYLELSEVIFQLFISKCKLCSNSFFNNLFLYIDRSLGCLLRFLARVMADHIPWASRGSVVKEKWFNLHSFSSSDTCVEGDGSWGFGFSTAPSRDCPVVHLHLPHLSWLKLWYIEECLWRMTFVLQTRVYYPFILRLCILRRVLIMLE